MSQDGELELACTELDSAIDVFRSLGMRLDVVYPADAPHTAVLSKDKTRLRLTTRPGEAPPPSDLPTFEPQFVLTRHAKTSAKGRAGMAYRDLVPGRLGGRYIASLITIAEGGPVDDWVHHHRVTFQMIYVRKGWVRVVYEDQGSPFVLQPGDLVLQPPGIRHRVLESSDGLEVIEISAPAVHETFADHKLELPNGRGVPDRTWSRQRFLRHIAARAEWADFLDGEAMDTEMHLASGGLAQVRTVRPGKSTILPFPLHGGELVFGFVLEGKARLDHDGGADLSPGDCFVIPPHEPWSLARMSGDFQLLHVTTARLD